MKKGKTTSKPSPVKAVLNKIEAYNDLQRDGTLSRVLGELANFLGKPYIRAYEWIVARRCEPELETFLIMQQWIELRIKLLTRKERARFNDILKLVTSQREKKS